MPRVQSDLHGRPVRDEADARALLAAIATSRVPLARWCEENDVNRWSLYHWRSKLDQQDRAGHRPALRLAEVDLPAPRPPAAPLSIVLPGGLRVEVPADFDEDALLRLLRVVAAC